MHLAADEGLNSSLPCVRREFAERSFCELWVWKSRRFQPFFSSCVGPQVDFRAYRWLSQVGVVRTPGWSSLCCRTLYEASIIRSPPSSNVIESVGDRKLGIVTCYRWDTGPGFCWRVIRHVMFSLVKGILFVPWSRRHMFPSRVP